MRAGGNEDETPPSSHQLWKNSASMIPGFTFQVKYCIFGQKHIAVYAIYFRSHNRSQYWTNNKGCPTKLDKTRKIWYFLLCKFWDLLPKTDFWRGERTLACIPFWGNSYVKFITLDLSPRFNCDEFNFHKSTPNYQSNMDMIVG